MQTRSRGKIVFICFKVTIVRVIIRLGKIITLTLRNYDMDQPGPISYKIIVLSCSSSFTEQIPLFDDPVLSLSPLLVLLLLKLHSMIVVVVTLTGLLTSLILLRLFRSPHHRLTNFTWCCLHPCYLLFPLLTINTCIYIFLSPTLQPAMQPAYSARIV